MQALLKNFFMMLSKNRLLNKAAKRWGLRFGASQVVAGETIPDAIKKVQELNSKGLLCTVDHLGEFVTSREEAIEAAQYCIDTLDAIYEAKVDCNLSLKLTQLGLDIDRQLCVDNMHAIMQVAQRTNNFVRIDMEDYLHCQPTLDILSELLQTYSNVGTVIQAYLHRASDDVERLQGVSLRLVKGAYKESPEVAFPAKEQIDENYLKIIKQHLSNGSYTAIASHDHRIIEQVKAFVNEHQIPREQLEFQMLYGFRNELQAAIAGEGYRVRVYVPYGDDWYGYFMRRLAERPQNISFALRGLFSK